MSNVDEYDTLNKIQYVKFDQCEHMYHMECAISWMKQQLNCPTCRAPSTSVIDEKGNQIYIAIKDDDLRSSFYQAE
ncbi:hypothetical protein B4U80_14034 [Leptotrombidium deliense]|uniref:RING-type domain-containing protein n=1 Tax=Leptotrombidium deliense TaxID=299467 RepID=A0A443S4M0_9ACAR|nr:hypothetical protein B4U80_14034 [Leptotrombidium deliense]